MYSCKRISLAWNLRITLGKKLIQLRSSFQFSKFSKRAKIFSISQYCITLISIFILKKIISVKCNEIQSYQVAFQNSCPVKILINIDGATWILIRSHLDILAAENSHFTPQSPVAIDIAPLIKIQVRRAAGQADYYIHLYMCLCTNLFVCVTPPGQTKNDKDLKFSTPVPLDPI